MGVSLDEAVLARLVKSSMHFEVLVDPDRAADIRDGAELDPHEDLAIDQIFKDARKGDHAAEENLEKVFGSTDVKEIATTILRDGEIQLTTDQRQKMQESKRRQIVQQIVRNAWNPQAKAPHPPDRIERAMAEARVHVDPFRSVDGQVKEILQKLKPLLPIAYERVKVAVRIPPEHTGHAYGVARQLGDLLRDEWQKDGSWIGVIEIPAGMQSELYEALNKATHGNVETKLLK